MISEWSILEKLDAPERLLVMKVMGGDIDPRSFFKKGFVMSDLTTAKTVIARPYMPTAGDERSRTLSFDSPGDNEAICAFNIRFVTRNDY